MILGLQQHKRNLICNWTARKINQSAVARHILLFNCGSTNLIDGNISGLGSLIESGEGGGAAARDDLHF